MTATDILELPGAEERTLLRDSLRGYLAEHWPVAGAVERASDEAAVKSLWQGLAAQGLTALGWEREAGGLREALIAMEELGRAAAPSPLAAALVFNLAVPGHAQDAGLRLAQRLHEGQACVALSLGELHSDPAAADLVWRENTLDGRLRFVDGALGASALLVATPDGLAIVDLAHAGASVVPTRAMGMEGWSEVHLHAVPVQAIDLPAACVQDIRLIAGLLLLARAHGAARRAFELAVDYAKERKQFGQPIGRFQAVQHKLANNLIALEGVRLTLEAAGEGHDLNNGHWRYFAQAALSYGGDALRQVALETQHAFGAIGYAEEHEAPRHFRRVHLDTLALGARRERNAELASALLDHETGLPEYDLGPAGNALRDEVRQWLATHWSGERKAQYDARPFHDREFDADFARDLGRTGWLGLSWPREFGGQARTPMEQLAFIEVMERGEAPPRFGASVQANALLMHGTEAQRARYLPEILRGEVMHGMGYSEPDSGSDLASLRTSAVRDGDEWVINGQKIWTTTWWGQYMFLAARTTRDAQPQHAGISMFIVPMDTPGITIKQATTMYDGSFANIFYDQVRIPAENIVGPVDGGWKVLTDALANERGMVGGGIVLRVAHAFDVMCREVRDQGGLRNDALVRERIGQLAAEIEVGRRLMIHCAELATSGTTPPALGAISKVFSGELMERFGEASLDILGATAALSQGALGSIANGRFEQNLRHSLMWVISIGTNEIQRSLIAQRGLGLPR